ncbi:MAG: hypothetical protein AB7G93_21925 [Bdellovibrionales bacterium]
MSARSISLLVCCAFTICARSVMARTDTSSGTDLTRGDHQAHAAASFVINSGLYASMRRAGIPKSQAIFIAPALTLSVGVLKELVFDSKLERSDITADAIGTGASVVLVFVVDWFE